MERVLEPELMDTADEAADYDAMDHAAVNSRFCEDLLSSGPLLASPVLDVGTGTARIPIEICLRVPDIEVVAIDLADHMLALARENVGRAGLAGRVRLERVDAKEMPYVDGQFGTTVSNSIVHHIPVPRTVLDEMWRVTARGGRLFVRDLARPSSPAELDRLVELYGGDPPIDTEKRPSFERQRALFRASLCAALNITEVTALVEDLGIPASAVRMTSDRHWTLAYVKP